jgi:hypothetical protein
LIIEKVPSRKPSKNIGSLLPQFPSRDEKARLQLPHGDLGLGPLIVAPAT